MRRALRFALAFLWLLVSVIPVLAQSGASAARKNVQDHLNRAQQALSNRQLDVAARELQEVLKIAPRNVEARANLGMIEFLQGRYADADKNLREALRVQPDLWKAQAILGLCEKALLKFASAQSLLEKSFPHLQDRQLRTRAGIALVEIDYQRRDFESALVILNSLQKIDAANPDVLYVSYRIHADLAAQARDNLALAAPDSARMHQLLAEHLVTEGKIKDAVAQFREALQIDSRLPGVHFELGEALLQESASQDARQQAEQEFKTALEVNPADAKSECSLGALANARGESDLARQHYSRSAELDPMYAEAQIGLGALLASGQPNEALPHLLQAVRLDPMSSGAHFRLSQVYRRLGRTSEANDEIAKFKQLRAAERRLQAAYGQGNAVSVTEKLINPDELQ